MDKTKLLKKVSRLYSLYQNGEIKTLPQHEVNPGLHRSTRENYLYFTLPPCINFQRSSPAMWQAALKTWSDPRTNYLFYPEKVARKSFHMIQKDLLTHKLGLQKNKHTEIWTRISKTLHEHFQDDPRNVLREGEFNAKKILVMLQKEKKDIFPYLGGPKMSNYWLYILSRYTNARFTERAYISIIPDTHVIQCSVKLGIVQGSAKPEQVAEAWKHLLESTEIQPVDMHPVLWNWSRNNFSPAV